MANEGYRLGIQVEVSSEAMLRFWKCVLRAKSLIEGEPYKLTLKFANLTKGDFPGGRISIMVVWASRQKSYWENIQIPPLRQEETKETMLVRRDRIVSAGFGLIFCYSLVSDDGSPASLWSIEGSEIYGIGKEAEHPIRGLRCNTWVDLYTKYGLLVSAVGLLIVALERLFSFFIWILKLIFPSAHA
jgi:hypothetical protein